MSRLYRGSIVFQESLEEVIWILGLPCGLGFSRDGLVGRCATEGSIDQWLAADMDLMANGK